MSHRGFTESQQRNRIDMATILVSDEQRQKMVALMYDQDTMNQPRILTFLEKGEWEESWVEHKSIYVSDELVRDIWEYAPDDDLPRHLFTVTASLLSTHYRKVNAPTMNITLDDNDAEFTMLNLWLLRILVPLGGHGNFIQKNGFRHAPLVAKLKLSALEDESPFNPENALILLRQKHQACEDHFAENPVGFPEVFETNLRKIQTELGFNDTETQLLAFTIFLYIDSVLEEATNLLEQLTTPKLYRVLATLLGIDEPQIRDALNHQGLLSRSGLLKVDQNFAQKMRAKLDLSLASSFDRINEAGFTPMDLIKEIVLPSKQPLLKLADYPFFAKQQAIITAYLAYAIAHQQKGVNLLLYGLAGTGKTQFIKSLAKELSLTCFKVSNIDAIGASVSGSQRLTACATAQTLLKNTPNSILLFDDAEDVFVGDYGWRTPAKERKAWFNQLLEETPVPTIWITSDATAIDATMSRRFDLIFELKIPNVKHREALLAHYTTELLSPSAIHRFAQHEHLSPAMIEKAQKVVSALHQQAPLTKDERDHAFEAIVNQTLTLQHHKPLQKAGETILPNHYHLRYLNTTEDMQFIADALVEHDNVRLCLYGPPGTGKTAFGYFLSQQLGKPLIIKRASDLLGMYVGETETNMARAFANAEEHQAILMIDEVDSFIASRAHTTHSWEVTSINEMLTQMERFTGIFIASTNMIDGLDQAAMRRFDLKIKVDYLNPEQKRSLFVDTCQQLGIQEDETALIHLQQIDTLTPGDFSVILRQHKFKPIKTVKALLSALEHEVLHKRKGKKIGF